MSNTPIEILYEEPRGHIGVSYNKFLRSWELHINIPIWGESIPERLDQMRTCKKVFEDVKETLRNRGIESVVGLARTGKEAKFDMLFGFNFTGYTAHTTKGVEKAILYLEL
jgi:hypothetical protein